MASYACRVKVNINNKTNHDKIRDWCRLNCKKLQWTIGLGYVYFSDPQDAVIFKLRFGSLVQDEENNS